MLTAALAAAMFLREDFLASLARALFGPRAGLDAGAAVLLALVGAARLAVPRVCRGLTGWVRHLPAGPAAHRRAALVAVLLVELPVLLCFALLAIGAHGGNAAREIGLALPLRALAAALFALPVARPHLTHGLALAAGLLAGAPGPAPLALSAALIAGADLAAGRLGPPGGRAMAWRSSGRATAWRLSGRATPWRLASGRATLWRSSWRATAWRLAWRALGWRVAGAYGGALLMLALGWAFVAHNELPPLHQARGALLAGGAALALLLASLGGSLAELRPAWPWARSLPWSAAERVRGDALLLGAHALPVAAAAAALAPWSWHLAGAVLALLALVPPLAAHTSGAMRRAPERRSGAAGEVLLGACFAVMLTALLPWLAAVALAATPWLLAAAARRERRQKVSRWLALHALAVGDPQSWSAG